MSSGSRGIFIGGLLLAAAAAGGCACSGYQIKIFRGEELRDMRALPIAIYFAPEEDLEKCQEDGLTAAKWFGDPSGRSWVDNQYLVRVDFNEGTQIDRRLPEAGVSKQLSRIFIWADYPPELVDPKQTRIIVDPNRIEKCNLVIKVMRGGLLVQSGGQTFQ